MGAAEEEEEGFVFEGVGDGGPLHGGLHSGGDSDEVVIGKCICDGQLKVGVVEPCSFQAKVSGGVHVDPGEGDEEWEAAEKRLEGITEPQFKGTVGDEGEDGDGGQGKSAFEGGRGDQGDRMLSRDGIQGFGVGELELAVLVEGPGELEFYVHVGSINQGYAIAACWLLTRRSI